MNNVQNGDSYSIKIGHKHKGYRNGDGIPLVPGTIRCLNFLPTKKKKKRWI